MSKTIKQLIEDKKCRKGPPAGITKSGAYWLAIHPIEIRSYGGDGIGQNDASLDNTLILRHYRDGGVFATVAFKSWHQNRGSRTEHVTVNSILDCTTVEQVIVALKSMSLDDCEAYSDRCQSKLEAELSAIGLESRESGPDE